eukprot:4115802-Amphidinium_carterae.1
MLFPLGRSIFAIDMKMPGSPVSHREILYKRCDKPRPTMYGARTICTCKQSTPCINHTQNQPNRHCQGFRSLSMRIKRTF